MLRQKTNDRSYIQQISTSVHTCYHMKLRNERSTAFVRNSV
ncbi:unnamed protein product [Acanthoscelides obtectus]|uniref:Uncharacterized protein n=1 Tax=Acanthoscelides obtectus TaxID=200917 RepID=A0A9P0Q152_ACAOB|nr:unnamed protein product [Acanthoscelides obtectus]CAK1684304.1 hypothetical protein AOBTE_LOCUS34791 [Acanthoscelides obtectus]